MLLVRKRDSRMDIKFMKDFNKISSQYREVQEGDPRLLCQASWSTVEYINDNLPDGMYWDNEDGVLSDSEDEKYADCEKVEFRGETYAVCPEAYAILDELLPSAVEHGLTEIFGSVSKN